MEERLYNLEDVRMISSAMWVIDQHLMTGDYDDNYIFSKIVKAYDELVKEREEFIVLDIVERAEEGL